MTDACGEKLPIKAEGDSPGAVFVCDLEPDHEKGDEGMHSFTDLAEDPVAIEYNVLWGTVGYDTEQR